jgi:hypothetical protein
MSSPKDPATEDVALLCGPTEDGAGTRVLRARQGRVEAGVVRPAKDGRPLAGAEVVRLRPREGTPALCDVDVLHEPEPTSDAAGRPARIATDRYRENWDRIFGEPSELRPDRSLN